MSLNRIWTILVILLAVLSTVACSSGAGFKPIISSEDGELDNGGNDLPAPSRDECEQRLPKLFTLSIADVENGAWRQTGQNSPTNPTIIEVGAIFGPDGSEPQALVHLDFVTDSTDWGVGDDAGFYTVFVDLILLDHSGLTELDTTYVANEPVTNSLGVHVGNRIARWDDPIALFDAQLLELNQTYILQSCRGILLSPDTGLPVEGRSQPIYVQARLTPP